MLTNQSCILLVSHAATVITLARELIGDRELPLRVGCCTLTNLKRKTGAKHVLGAWEVLSLGSGSHLRDGIQRDWGFDDVVISNGKVSAFINIETQLTGAQVIDDPRVPSSEGEEEGPVGCQLQRSNL
jgi:transcription factor C subunit 7